MSCHDLKELVEIAFKAQLSRESDRDRHAGVSHSCAKKAEGWSLDGTMEKHDLLFEEVESGRPHPMLGRGCLAKADVFEFVAGCMSEERSAALLKHVVRCQECHRRLVQALEQSMALATRGEVRNECAIEASARRIARVEHGVRQQTRGAPPPESETMRLAETRDLWQLYKDEDDSDARDKLILHYSPLVKYVAGRISANLPQNVDTADLISYGIFGLIDAIEKFELSREIKFETYAIARIKGAIIDELRSLDWVPRSVRARGRQLEKAYIELENKHRRVPTDKEVAKHMGISVDELQDLLAQLSSTSVAGLEGLWRVGSETADWDTLILDEPASGEPAASDPLRLRGPVAAVIDKLPEREKAIIALYYYEGLTLREIGEALNLTESRVSQLHRKAMLQLLAARRRNT
jgi:RNA polymerase sigma factor for flagellar operon FliA